QGQLRAGGTRLARDGGEGRPGWSFPGWGGGGGPVRPETGPKDTESSSVLAARRDTREKQALAMDGLPQRIAQLLDEVQASLFERACQFRTEHTQTAATYEEFKQIMEGRPGFVIAAWCGARAREGQIKA